jgi:N-sulfoglucosamine sulfohydrolase
MIKFILALASFMLFAVYLAKGGNKEPNIIFIIGDDISWDDLGCYGNKKIHTPNLDKLAAEGMKFTNMYLTSSSCSPSRTSILTGRYPHNTGAAELHTPLPAHLLFFPELLKKQGYYSALVGKWHEGPETKRAYDTLLVDPVKNGEGAEEQWISLLRSRPKEKPFFFWLAPLDAHRPWSSEFNLQGHDHALAEVEIPTTLVDTKETRLDLTKYYDEIARLDYHLGELLLELEKEGLSENTIIIFMADNGRPFPGSKTRLYDRGIKAPFIVKWPQAVGRNQVCKSLISSIDIGPTILDAAGISSHASFQGISFLKLLKQPDQRFRNFVFAEHNWHDYEAYERAVRTPDFLYIVNGRPNLDNGGPIDANQSPSADALKTAHKKGTLNDFQKDIFTKPRLPEELYDCKKDALQSKNQISNKVYAVQKSQLRSILKKWQTQTGDTKPDHLTPDWYDRANGEPLPAKGIRGEMPGAATHASKINHKGPF